jgi:hypothetical protein
MTNLLLVFVALVLSCKRPPKDADEERASLAAANLAREGQYHPVHYLIVPFDISSTGKYASIVRLMPPGGGDGNNPFPLFWEKF